MALPTASDNPFPSLLITEGTEPSAPAAGKQRLYVDSTTHELMLTNSSGTQKTIEHGRELDYVEITGNVTITGTAEGSETTCITGTSQAYTADPIIIEVFSPRCDVNAASAGQALIVVLYDGATILGRIETIIPDSTGASHGRGFTARRKLTPTAATHQYIVKAYKTSTNACLFGAGAGGTGANVPAYLRITRA